MDTEQQNPQGSGRRRGKRRTMVGIVTSDKMDKTVVVSVSRRVLNRRFGKYQTKRKSYKAHSENNDIHVGDRVLIVETRPLSRDKRWRVQKLLERAGQV
ncbi:MAG: 30S ribosomal protein S17 [Myxococcales bacterium]|nr:30S ribosomal protein S17 [Myxococcota bacterium]MDW8282181.1 30S ribosomal protein S17 [Myxococcales bacterium]